MRRRVSLSEKKNKNNLGLFINLYNSPEQNITFRKRTCSVFSDAKCYTMRWIMPVLELNYHANYSAAWLADLWLTFCPFLFPLSFIFSLSGDLITWKSAKLYMMVMHSMSVAFWLMDSYIVKCYHVFVYQSKSRKNV